MFASAFLSHLATLVGLLAGGIAIGGFLGHARPGLSEGSDAEIRHATTTGGLIGMS
jgi:hypothetical protein